MLGKRFDTKKDFIGKFDTRFTLFVKMVSSRPCEGQPLQFKVWKRATSKSFINTFERNISDLDPSDVIIPPTPSLSLPPQSFQHQIWQILSLLKIPNFQKQQLKVKEALPSRQKLTPKKWSILMNLPIYFTQEKVSSPNMIIWYLRISWKNLPYVGAQSIIAVTTTINMCIKGGVSL